ncbi:MAG: insulinase family protein [Clostridia bacterium]|nr:insulinase family protein [Clostridia bacterium]
MIEISDFKLKEKYYKFKHKSGLDIYVFPKNMTCSYAMFGTEYGSVDNCFRIKGETEYTSVPDGIAHYLEHRMFTQKDGSDITERFSACGADSNAYTSSNKTVYLCNSSDNFKEALAALVEFVTEPYFTEELVEKERNIIIQEIKMSDDSPYSRCYQALMEAIYHHNSARVDVAGTVESVSEITADMLNKCYNTFYTPNNMALVVCGNISPEEVAEVVEYSVPESYVALDVERKYCDDEPRSVYKKLVEAYMDVAKPIFSIGIKDIDIPADNTERMRKFTAMGLLCELLFSRSGELYNTLFESGMVTPDFGGSYTSSKTFAYTMVSGEADDPKEVLKYIKKYISEFQFDENDLTRCKRVLYAEFLMDFDSTEEIANNMVDYIFEGFDLFEYAHMIENITVDEIKDLLTKMFKEEYFSMSVVYPIEEERK